MPLILTSSVFGDRQPIPTRYTCEGDDVSPPLEWTGVPGDARSLALIVEDPDAPDPEAPARTWVHWVLCKIPADAMGLAEGASNGNLPGGTIEGLNDWKKVGYGGPCPPIGRHRYFFRLYALDTALEHFRTFTKSQLELAMQRHILATAALVGTYQKQTSRNLAQARGARP